MLVLAPATLAQAQGHPLDFTCATEEAGGGIGPGENATIPVTGTFRALTVFVRFKDDDTSGDCSRGHVEWPYDEPRPVLAQYLLASNPMPPFADSSLTGYFYEQSRGNFTLYGDTVSYKTAYDESHYYNPVFGLERDVLTAEALDPLTATGRVDLRDYDDNGDGYVDHIFFVIRRLNVSGNCVYRDGGCASGISSLSYTVSDTTRYGIKISSGRSGSYNVYSGAHMD